MGRCQRIRIHMGLHFAGSRSKRQFGNKHLSCVDHSHTSLTRYGRLTFYLYAPTIFGWYLFQVLSISLAALGSLMWLRKNKPKTLIPIIYACAGIVATMPSITRCVTTALQDIFSRKRILWVMFVIRMVLFAVIWNWGWDGTSQRWLDLSCSLHWWWLS